MTEKIELTNEWFDCLLYVVIDTYSGALQEPEFDGEPYYDPNCENWYDTHPDADPNYDYEYDFDYDGYMERVNELVCKFFETTVFETVFKPLGFSKLNFEKLLKPCQYNYVGDSVLFNLEYDTEKFKTRSDVYGKASDLEMWMIDRTDELEQNPAFEQFLKDNFSSREGYTSFNPSNIVELCSKLGCGFDEYSYSAKPAFMAAWVAAEVAEGNIDVSELEDDFYSEVVETLMGYEFWYRTEDRKVS
jgi:hypothetical protein